MQHLKDLHTQSAPSLRHILRDRLLTFMIGTRQNSEDTAQRLHTSEIRTAFTTHPQLAI